VGVAARAADTRARVPAVAAPRRGAVLATLCLSVLIINLDGTILNVALPTIVRDLHATASQLQWMVDAYAVVLAGLLLIAGSLGDHLGRKWVYLVGVAVFAAGSAASAFAGSPDQLIATRAAMGIGAAAIMPSTLSILTTVFSEPASRARAIGVWSGTSGLGLAIGPVVGGWLLAHYWWGSVFLINLPVALLAGAAGAVLIPNSKSPAAKRPDFAGALLSLLGVSLLLWAIIEAPSRGWDSAVILGSLTGSLGVLALFAAWERRSTHALLELSFFGHRRFSVAVGGLAMVFFALSGALFLLTQYLQFCLGYSALSTGVRIAPIAAVLLVVASLSSAAVRRFGTTLVVVTGALLVAGGLGLLATVTVHTGYRGVVTAFLLLGVGTGLAVAPCTESVMGSVPAGLAGVGSATNSTALQIGGSLGVAVLGSLLSTHYQSQMALALAHGPITGPGLASATGSIGGAMVVAARVGGPVGSALVAAAQRSYVHAMVAAVSVGALTVLVAAAVIAALLPPRAS
jgi:EmrB/QacA subfamily drug resistance transporter